MGKAYHTLQRARSRSRRLIEVEHLVQHAHGELGVLLVDDDGDLDLRCGNHLDVDAVCGKRREGCARDASVGAHADVNVRHFGGLVNAHDLTRFDVGANRAKYLKWFLKVVSMYGERKIGEPVMTHFLQDHVDI